MLKESETKLYGNDQYEGFGIDLIEEMAALTGFNYTFILQEDNSNGVKNMITGRWSGMLGRLIDGVILFSKSFHFNIDKYSRKPTLPSRILL